MAISRIEVNGDLSILKTELENSGLFDSVVLDNESSPTLLTCKDSDNNTLFTLGSSSSSTWTYTAYKDSTHNITSSGSFKPLYIYHVGTKSAVIEITGRALLVLSKTNTDIVGFAFPSGGTTKYAFNMACWGDDTALTTPLTFAASSNPAVGNHCQLVEIPMHGTFSNNIYLPYAFYMPIVQTGMREAVQEITGIHGTYLSNGYFAIKDNTAN